MSISYALSILNEEATDLIKQQVSDYLNNNLQFVNVKDRISVSNGLFINENKKDKVKNSKSYG